MNRDVVVIGCDFGTANDISVIVAATMKDNQFIILEQRMINRSQTVYAEDHEKSVREKMNELRDKHNGVDLEWLKRVHKHTEEVQSFPNIIAAIKYTKDGNTKD